MMQPPGAAMMCRWHDGWLRPMMFALRQMVEWPLNFIKKAASRRLFQCFYLLNRLTSRMLKGTDMLFWSRASLMVSIRSERRPQ